MAKLIKVYREQTPAVTLAGKVYHDCDRDAQGMFAGKWGEWFANDWFDLVQSQGKPLEIDCYVGAMRVTGDSYEYWIGVPMESVGELPPSFTSIDIPAGSFGVAWIQGIDNPELYGMHDACMEAFAKEGWQTAPDTWYIERYVCPRFTQPDENGEVILDYMVSII